MKRAAILMMLALALGLMGCATSTPSGVRPDPLPASVAQKCAHPSALVSRGGTVADDKISMGRIGLALVSCGKRHELAVAAYEGLRVAVSEKR